MWALSGPEMERSGQKTGWTESGCHKNRLERWAENWRPLTLRSHALETSPGWQWLCFHFVCLCICISLSVCPSAGHLEKLSTNFDENFEPWDVWLAASDQTLVVFRLQEFLHGIFTSGGTLPVTSPMHLALNLRLRLTVIGCSLQ